MPKHNINTHALVADYLARGGRITKCPNATVVSKWDRRFKGIGFVPGGTRLFMGL